MAAMDGMGMAVEERIINEEYKIWKKNTPFLWVSDIKLTKTVSVCILLLKESRNHFTDTKLLTVDTIGSRYKYHKLL